MAFFNKKQNNNKSDNVQKQSLSEEQDRKTVDNYIALYRKAYTNKSQLHIMWDKCYKAYDGSYFKKSLPDYKMQEVSNYVFSTLETIKPIMLAENPKILALPNKETDYSKSELVQHALDYEWQRTSMFTKMNTFLTTGILYGTAIFGLFWDGEASNGLGEIKPIMISPFNFFIDPMATSLEDAQYVIYATYRNVGEVAEEYPDKKEELMTSKTAMQDEYLNYGKDESNTFTSNNILCLEVYKKDYSYDETVDDEEIEDENGNKTKTGNQVITRTRKYPNGRRILIAGDVLLSDGENPYKDGKFPFIIWKCYDVPGQFWGKGEVENIISPMETACELTNSIIESAQMTANPIWILDKNCGVEKKSLTNRKGLVVRKNPGTEVKRDSPPAIPAYVQQMVDVLKKDIEQISGVYDVTRGERPTGITAAAAIQALNEQAQGRIKLKVQCMEIILGELGDLWLSRIQQYWVTIRTIRIMGQQYVANSDVDQMQQNNPQNTQNNPQIGQKYKLPGGKTMSFSDVNGDAVDGDFDIYIVAGSTMAVNKTAKLQQVIQLAQTSAEDGLPMLDRQSVLENADLDNTQEILQRFEQLKQQQTQNAPQPEPPVPNESMNFKDLPPEGQVQMAAKVGIQLNPDMINQNQNNQLVKQTAQQQTVANVNHQNQLEQIQTQHNNNLEQQQIASQQNALQGDTNQLQSESEGTNSGNSGNNDTTTQVLTSVLEKIITTLVQKDPQEFKQLAQQIPELGAIIQELQNNQ